MAMSLKKKLLLAIILVSLAQLYWVGFTLLSNNFTNFNLHMNLMLLYGIAPVLALVLLGGLLLGPILGALTSASIVLVSFVFTGLGIFSSIAFWSFNYPALVLYVLVAVCAGFFSNKASSYRLLMLTVFCSLILGYFSQVLISYFTQNFGTHVTLFVMLEVWVVIYGLGVIVHTLFVPMIYLAIKQILKLNQPTDEVHQSTRERILMLKQSIQKFFKDESSNDDTPKSCELNIYQSKQ